VVVDALQSYFCQNWPGLPVSHQTLEQFVELLQSSCAEQNNAFIIFREDLPDLIPPVQALADACGAEAGDEIIELRLSPHKGELLARSWQLQDVSAG
jgi:hypothetical protein